MYKFIEFTWFAVSFLFYLPFFFYYIITMAYKGCKEGVYKNYDLLNDFARDYYFSILYLRPHISFGFWCLIVIISNL